MKDELKRIGVIAHMGHDDMGGRIAMTTLAELKSAPPMIMASPRQDAININGEYWIPREKTKTRFSPIFMAVMLMAGVPQMANLSQQEKEQLDLISEYRLVMQKKSNRSANGRRYIVAEFERNFEKLKE
jgi:hypothetical protein